MRSFRDNLGREWIIEIHVTAVKRVRAHLSLDLYSLLDDRLEALGALLADPVRFVDVLYVLCMDEAKELEVTDEDFGQGLGGDSLAAAQAAFLGEFADFFPDRKIRETIKRIFQAAKEVQEDLAARLEKRTEAIDIGSIVNRLTEQSSNSPESSESILGRIRSAV
jgi:hypothetical protein